MTRSLAVATMVIGSIVVLAADVAAQDWYSSSRYINSRGYYQGPRLSRILNRYIDYGTRSYNNQRAYSTEYSRSTSYGLYNSPYYYSPYQSRSSYGYRATSQGYPFGYGYGQGFDTGQTFSYGY